MDALCRRDRIIVVASLAAAIVAALSARAEDAQAKTEGAGRYMILATVRDKTMQEDLNKAANVGFRVVSGDAGYNILLLEKDKSGAKREYVFEDRMTRAAEEHKLNGYRVLPFSFSAGVSSVGAVLEKLADGEAQPEYKVINTMGTGNFQKDLNEWSGKGFQLVAFSGSDRNYGLMERSVGTPPSGPTDRYVVLATSRTGTMEKELANTVARGYRVVGATGAKKEMLVVLEKTAPGDPIPEYKLLSTLRSGTFEHEIAAANRDGYKVMPMTLCALIKSAGMLGTTGYELAVIMEKSPDATSREYKMLSTSRVSTLGKELAGAEAEGWSVDRLFLSYQEQILILQKPRQ